MRFVIIFNKVLCMYGKLLQDRRTATVTNYKPASFLGPAAPAVARRGAELARDRKRVDF